MSSSFSPTHLFFNGAILPVDAPLFPGADLGILRGYGVFDFFQVRRGVPLFVDAYLTRFSRSASILGLSVPLDRAAILAAIRRLLEANNTTEGRVRLVLTGGASEDGMTPGRENFLILLHPPVTPPPEPRGIKILTRRYEREFPEAKTTNYLTAVQSMGRLREAEAAELLYHDNTRVLEASRANVFVVTRDNRLATPATGMLQGITRQRTLAVVGSAPESVGVVAVEERDVGLEELDTAREVFLTGSGRLIMPVTQIDDQRVANGAVGPVATKTLALLRKDADAYVAGALASSERNSPTGSPTTEARS